MINIPCIIDGGLSNVLEQQGHDLNHKLWTAYLLDKNPEAIIQAHLEYLKAGAQCITTASYQASFPGLMEMGYSKDASTKLILQSVQLAEEAIKIALESQIISERVIIAASIGPYGAYLADGSEYRGNYGISDQTLKDFHEERMQLLDQSDADILACETIPSLQEAKILGELLENIETPAWISFSCRDEAHINDGSKIEECVALFKDHPKVLAIGVNCTNPQYISGLIQCMKENRGNQKIIIYPNSGEAYNPKTKTWQGLSEPRHFAEMAQEWVKSGADMIGGCCRIGPEHIRGIRDILN